MTNVPLSRACPQPRIVLQFNSRGEYGVGSKADAGIPYTRRRDPMDPKANDAPTVQPTIDYVPSASALPPRVEVVAGSGVHLSEETRSLLRIRLRAVALAMSCAFGAFLVRDFWLAGHYRDPLLLAFHVVVVAAFLASYAALSGRRPIALRRLRALELVLFGMTIAFFVTIHYRLVQLRVAEGDRVMLMATVKNTVLFVFAMIVLYGMFIPNTWRRAAAVVGVMLAATLLSPLALRILHPEVYPVRRAAADVRDRQRERPDAGDRRRRDGLRHPHHQRPPRRGLRGPPAQPVPAQGPDRRRRHGRGLPGRAPVAEAPCAIKLIAPDRAGDPKALARFEREVRTTARLSHPNTVEIYDYGRTDDGTFYYVMELLNGLSLADLVERHGPLPPGRAIFLLRQACGALAEAHAAGLVHRDLKPANIFAARRGNLHDFVKLLDFGLVLPPPGPVDRRTQPGRPHRRLAAVHGPGAGHRRLARPDARTDLYGLGAVAYYLLTGRAPFAGRDRDGRDDRRWRATPSSRRPGIGPGCRPTWSASSSAAWPSPPPTATPTPTPSTATLPPAPPPPSGTSPAPPTGGAHFFGGLEINVNVRIQAIISRTTRPLTSVNR